MKLPQEIDDYIKEKIDHSLGIPVSSRTLQSKLISSEAAQQRLRDQCVFLQSQLEAKDIAIARAKAEATMNAQAVKKFAEENQRLCSQHSHLLRRYKKLKRKRFLYGRDRVLHLEERVEDLSERLHFFRREDKKRKISDSSPSTSSKGTSIEDDLLESVLALLITTMGTAASARAFMEANDGHEPCRRLLDLWDWLSPSTHKALSLAAEMKTLEKDKERLMIDLTKTEEQVEHLRGKTNLVNDEVDLLLRLGQGERGQNPGGKPPFPPAKDGKKHTAD